MTAASPAPVRLDPLGRDQHGQNEGLRALGPVVPVELPGGVPAWSVTRHDLLQELLADPRVGKDHRHWRALADGRVPDGWPLINFVTVPGMTTADGDDHRRLRALVTQAFTPRRVAALRPRVEAMVAELLDRLAAALADGGTADLRAHFAYPLPMRVICELLGVPEHLRDELHRLCGSVVGSATAPADVLADQRALYALLGGIVADHRATPGDDLTSDLIAADEDGDRLAEQEIAGTLLLMLVAGHETTLNLITNAVRALLAHPEQLALVTAGTVPWAAVIEETLRWDSPVGQFPLRYAIEDIDIAGTRIPRGDAILASYAAVGRDPGRHGPDAGRFDITRPATRHLSFGHGAHFCLGAPLARLEAEIALPALFARFPGLTAAAAPEELEPLPSIVSNSVRVFPVTAEPAEPAEPAEFAEPRM